MKRKIEASIYNFVRYSGINLLVLTLIGVYFGGWYCYVGFFIVFIIYYIAELVLKISGIGTLITHENEFDFIDPKAPNWVDKYGLYYYAVTQIICIPLIFYLIIAHQLSHFEIAGVILSTIFACGTIGGIAAHDMIHSRNPMIKWFGVVILTTFNHGTFAVSHILGHHRLIGQEEDCSTAQYRENLYHFLYRAVFKSHFLAWRLESRRNKSILQNDMLYVVLIQVIFSLAIVGLGGWKLFIIHTLFSVGAICFIEIINYITHYGAKRKKNKNGGWDKVGDDLTWETNNKITNWFIFNTGKHAHHHRRPNHKNYELLMTHEVATFRLGLQFLSLLAFVPPLYYIYMDNLIEERRAHG